MPDPQGTLSIFAEVSVALVGFSGIVIEFVRRSLGELTQLELRRLSNLFVFGGGVLLFSLLGISLLHTPISRAVVWTGESALMFTLGAPWVIYDWRRVARLDASERSQVKGYILIPFNVAGILILLLQLANTFVIHGSWPLFLGLVFAVAFALQQFVLLVKARFLGPRDV